MTNDEQRMSGEKLDLQSILAFAVKMNASDIHLRVGAAPVLRIKGDLVNLKFRPFSDADMTETCQTLMSNTPQAQKLELILETDGSIDIPGLCRFRYNIFKTEGKLAAVLRVIPIKIS